MIAKYRFIEMIVRPRITYFFLFLIRWHTTTYITGLFLHCTIKPIAFLDLFFPFIIIFFFYPSPGFFPFWQFIKISSLRCHNDETWTVLLLLLYCVRYIPTSGFYVYLSLSLCLHALSKEKHLVHVALLWIFALPADHVR